MTPTPDDRRRMGDTVRTIATMIHANLITNEPHEPAAVSECDRCTGLAESIVLRLTHTSTKPHYDNTVQNDFDKPMAVLTAGTLLLVEVAGPGLGAAAEVNVYINGAVPTPLAAMVLDDIAHNMLTAQVAE